MYENVMAEYCLNTEAEPKANVKEINEFTYNHKQSKEEEDDGTSQEQLEHKLTICHNALNSIIELQEFSLHHNNSKLFDIIFWARILIEN
jgi:hypothetical protein